MKQHSTKSPRDGLSFGRPLSAFELDQVGGGIGLTTEIVLPPDSATAQATGRRIQLPVEFRVTTGATP